MKRKELLLKPMFPTFRLTPRYTQTSLLLSRSERLNHARNAAPGGNQYKIASVSGLADAALLLQEKTAGRTIA